MMAGGAHRGLQSSVPNFPTWEDLEHSLKKSTAGTRRMLECWVRAGCGLTGNKSHHEQPGSASPRVGLTQKSRGGGWDVRAQGWKPRLALLLTLCWCLLPHFHQQLFLSLLKSCLCPGSIIFSGAHSQHSDLCSGNI